MTGSIDRGTWFEPGKVLGCAYPRKPAALAVLAEQQIKVLINLHTLAHPAASLIEHGLTCVHLPVVDFTAPSPEQLKLGVATIIEAHGREQAVAVHCASGFGRTGTLVACYFVAQGLTASDAIQHVRKLRPGSIETRDQIAAIKQYAQTIL